MTEKAKQKEFTIDAAGQRLGRIATVAARVLMGKHDPSYEPHKAGDTKVIIQNAEKLVLPEAKKDTKHYKRYSGYPGGQTEESMQSVLDRKGVDAVIRHAVRGMLPGNKLRPHRLKRLEIQTN